MSTNPINLGNSTYIYNSSSSSSTSSQNLPTNSLTDEDLDAILNQADIEFEEERKSSSSSTQGRVSTASTSSTSYVDSLPKVNDSDFVLEEELNEEERAAYMQQQFSLEDFEAIMRDVVDFCSSEEGQKLILENKQYIESMIGIKPEDLEIMLNQYKQNPERLQNIFSKQNLEQAQQMQKNPSLFLKIAIEDYEKNHIQIIEFSRKIPGLDNLHNIEKIKERLDQIGMLPQDKDKLITYKEISLAFDISVIHALSCDKTIIDLLGEYEKKEEKPMSLLPLPHNDLLVFESILPPERFELFKKNMREYLLQNIHLYRQE